jgi:hypothetical protein
MLSTCIELFLKGHRVQDIYFVPISVTYERLLEEMLYANELLGIPKPKETVSGLVKARTILGQSFGTMFINIGRPISLRDVIEQQLSGELLTDRRQLTITPAFIFELSTSQFKAVESISYALLLVMLRNQVIQPINLIATCLLLSTGGTENGARFQLERSIEIKHLCLQVSRLKRILVNLGVKVYWPIGEEELEDKSLNKLTQLILANAELHLNLFDSRSSTTRLALKRPIAATGDGKRVDRSILFESASYYIALCSYRNQLANHLVRASFLCTSLLACSNDLTADLVVGSDETLTSTTGSSETFAFLCRLFNREFIFRANEHSRDYADSLKCLVHLNILKWRKTPPTTTPTTNLVELEKFNLKQFLFFCRLNQSLIENYSQIYKILLALNKLEVTNEKNFVKALQAEIFERMLGGGGSQRRCGLDGHADLEILSLNMLSNSLLTLKQFGILWSTNGPPYKINREKLVGLSKKLAYIVQIVRLRSNQLARLGQSFVDSSDAEGFDFAHDETQNEQIDKNELLGEYENHFISAKI